MAKTAPRFNESTSMPITAGRHGSWSTSTHPRLPSTTYSRGRRSTTRQSASNWISYSRGSSTVTAAKHAWPDWIGRTWCRWQFKPSRVDVSPSFIPHSSTVEIGRIAFLSSQFHGKWTDCLSRNQRFDPMFQITRVAAAHESHSHMNYTCIRGHCIAF